MNPRIKKIFQLVLVNDISYKILSPIIWLSDRLKASRDNYAQSASGEKLRREANLIFSDKIVRHGPFKGMIFSTEPSAASSTYAKLLGSYESEIHPFINIVLARQHQLVVNIGCDDGYYALGMARRKPGVKVIAYDNNKNAVAKAFSLAKQNNLERQVSFAGTFRTADIDELDESINTLFIVDCEGAEREIFTQQNAVKLKHADLLIELHINLHPDLEDYFSNMFSHTHHVQMVNSLDDHLKARHFDYPEIAGRSYELKKYITQERAVFMQWMLLTAKENQA